MCDIASLRHKIDSVLNDVVEAQGCVGGRGLDAAREMAIERLTSEYDDACPDQCIRARVEAFFEERGLRASVEVR